jgi:serine/threonine protein kinase
LFVLIELLEKNRQKRINLEDALSHEWFSEFTEIHKNRLAAGKDENGLDNKFEAFTLTEVNSHKMMADAREL